MYRRWRCISMDCIQIQCDVQAIPIAISRIYRVTVLNNLFLLMPTRAIGPRNRFQYIMSSDVYCIDNIITSIDRFPSQSTRIVEAIDHCYCCVWCPRCTFCSSQAPNIRSAAGSSAIRVYVVRSIYIRCMMYDV